MTEIEFLRKSVTEALSYIEDKELLDFILNILLAEAEYKRAQTV